jgi:hypothetical protein
VRLKYIKTITIIAIVYLIIFGYLKFKKKNINFFISTDYSKKINWLNLSSGEKDVDVFFLYPTCYFDKNQKFCSIDDKNMRSEAIKIKKAHSKIFDSANFYAPFYRQLSLDFILKLNSSSEIFREIEKISLIDAENAFEYYLKNYNNKKSIIFVSHSQGSIVMSRLLLKIKKKYPKLLKHVIAIYLIGYPVTQEYCNQLGLLYASKKNDIGVIVSWNTESPEASIKNSTNPFIFQNDSAIVINPINWKRDETYSSEKENLGSYVRFGNKPPVFKSQFADAKLNLERNVVVTNANVKVESPWPAGVLHRYDFDLFYYNFKQNIRDRIEAYKNNKDANY